jgi:hypothetical protein
MARTRAISSWPPESRRGRSTWPSTAADGRAREEHSNAQVRDRGGRAPVERLALGATVFREPIAWAAQSLDATIVGPVVGQNVRVHEEGTANVKAADNPALQPFHRFVSGDGTVLSFTVPSGKRLVIEEVSFLAQWGDVTTPPPASPIKRDAPFVLPRPVIDRVSVPSHG